MSQYTIGDRMGVVRNAGKETRDGQEVTVAYLFGYGEYQGEKVPPEDVNPIFHELKIPNPCIKLDNGTEVYGFESWWGPEEAVKKRFADYIIEFVEPDRE